jgi:hypothetical protein
MTPLPGGPIHEVRLQVGRLRSTAWDKGMKTDSRTNVNAKNNTFTYFSF